MDARFEKAVLTDLELHLKDLHINDTCLYCHSRIVVFNDKRENVKNICTSEQDPPHRQPNDFII